MIPNIITSLQGKAVNFLFLHNFTGVKKSSAMKCLVVDNGTTWHTSH